MLQRIAYHPRSYEMGQSTTLTEHMPQAHRRHHQWSPQQFLSWSETVGPQSTQIAHYLIQNKPNPECCYRIHLGFLKLAKQFGKPRLEQACQYACRHRLYSYSHVKSILDTQCDKAPKVAANDQAQPTCQHENVRGSTYYSTKKGNE